MEHQILGLVSPRVTMHVFMCDMLVTFAELSELIVAFKKHPALF